MVTLSNEKLTIQVAEHGAELSSIVAKATGREYLWQADPVFWKRHSPVLFPIVGSVWNQTYRAEGREFTLSQHGFARDRAFHLVEADDRSTRFLLESDADTFKIYPYHFALEIGYRLNDDQIEVIWKVSNRGDKQMHFQIGAHPAFYYPNYVADQPERGYFSFGGVKSLEYRALAEKGCVGDEVRPVPLDAEGLLPLDVHTFDIDTFIVGKYVFFISD